ncbi:MAG: LytTR family DNA-binding domain-containing protein [Planctomycetota bacterium]
MEKIRTIIVDDEPLARERIRTLLDAESDFEIVAECDGGAAAVDSVDSLQPDLLFLDIQMPEIDGFDVLSAIDPENIPAVIFVTAYDQYAVRAFEVHAIDYLLKPFDKERFKEALARVRTRTDPKGKEDKNALTQQIAKLLDDVRTERRANDRILIKSEGKIFFLSTQEIDWVEAAGNYMRLHAGNEIHLMRETMSGMETRLPSDLFVRIHRSTMVNFNRIKEMQPAFSGEFTVILKNGEELKLSRKYRAELERRIGKPL